MRLAEGFDPNSVTPGVVGFLATFALVSVSIVLFVSMSRRIRRLDYRARSEQPPVTDAADDPASTPPEPPAPPRRPDDDASDRGDRGGPPPPA